MTKRHIDLVEALKNTDLDLITDFLANELDPGQVAEVRRRLEEDSAFRDFAAPIVAAWNVKPLWQREPLARAEVEKAWAKFTKKAGFKHQRRRRWMRWVVMVAFIILSPFLAIFGYSMFLAGQLLRDSMREASGTMAIVDIPDTTQLTTLPNGAKVWLDSGATLRPIGRVDDSGPQYRVALDGRAIFLMHVDSAVGPVAAQGVAVETSAGVVLPAARAVEVDARADTTDVRVVGIRQDTRSWIMRAQMAGLLPAEAPLGATIVMVMRGERGRMIRGSKAQKFAVEPETTTVSPR